MSHSPATGNVLKARPINTFPFIIHTVDADVMVFLEDLPAPDFNLVADAKALWATSASHAGEGSQYDDGEGSAFIVSAETYKYVKTYRY